MKKNTTCLMFASAWRIKDVVFCYFGLFLGFLECHDQVKCSERIDKWNYI
jgi:hypothetical protein